MHRAGTDRLNSRSKVNRDLGSESQGRHTSVLIYNDGEIKPVAQAGLETHL